MNDTDDEGIGGPKDRGRRPDQRDFGALVDLLCRVVEPSEVDEARAAVVAEYAMACDERDTAVAAWQSCCKWREECRAELAAAKGDPGDVRPIGWRFKYKESDDWNYTENAKAAKRYKDSEYFVQPVFEANAVKRWNDEWRASQQEVFDLQAELAAERQSHERTLRWIKGFSDALKTLGQQIEARGAEPKS